MSWGRGYGYGYFGEYVSVGEKRRSAEKKVSELRKKDKDIMPIPAFSDRLIAHSFWGRSWCDNMQSYSDYENRLPRGRQYVRHGCVCDLRINEGQVTALVNGSSLYKVRITIDKLSEERTKQLQELLQGRISSLLDMLQGKIPRDVKELVGDPKNGIIPFPKEIHFTCSCPDSAGLCKHIAAVLYGIGRRLDTDPGVLFTLRGLDPELLCTPAQLDLTAEHTEESLSGGEDLSALFGIDLGDMGAEDQAAALGVPAEPAPATAAATARPADGETAKKPQRRKKASAGETSKQADSEPAGTSSGTSAGTSTRTSARKTRAAKAKTEAAKTEAAERSESPARPAKTESTGRAARTTKTQAAARTTRTTRATRTARPASDEQTKTAARSTRAARTASTEPAARTEETARSTRSTRAARTASTEPAAARPAAQAAVAVQAAAVPHAGQAVPAATVASAASAEKTQTSESGPVAAARTGTAVSVQPSSVQPPFDSKHPTSEGLRALVTLSGRTEEEVSYLMRISRVTLKRWLAQDPGPLRVTGPSLSKIELYQKKLMKNLARK